MTNLFAPGTFSPDPRPATVQTMNMPTGDSEPRALITEHGLRHFGLTTTALGWLIRAPHTITPEQLSTADTLASDAGMSVDSHRSQPSYTRVRDNATTAGILVALIRR